jgi:Uma2 family endonuclease
MVSTVRPLTFEEFIELPEGELGKDELLRGQAIHTTLATQDHNDTLFFKLTSLIENLKSEGGAQQTGEVHFGAGYRIELNSLLGPDVSVTNPSQACGDYYEGAPLIAIEIVSESISAANLDVKVETYLQNGGQEVWVAYRETRRVLTYFAGRDEIESGREYIRSRIFPEVKSIPLSAIWDSRAV